jgi:hypothetical protein
MKGILALVLILLISLSELASSESWYGYVKTTNDTWNIYRHSNNMSFQSDQYVEGKIEPFEGPGGRVLSPYSSYFEEIDLNDVRLKARTAAMEGNYSSEDLIDVKAEVKSPVGLYIDKSADSGLYIINFIERWPAEVSASRTLEYSGIGINNRDFIENNMDFAETNLLYNKKLSKDLFAGMSLERMNVTVIATDESIILAEEKATRDLNFRISADTTGIADLKYLQSGPGFNKAAITGHEILNKGDERFHGSFNITKNIHMRSQFDNFRSDDIWLPCCYQGWMDMNPIDKRTHSADGIFDCTCSGLPEVET